ncbi:MAG: hypothetical protein K2G45_03700, partial [Lachnospiraceae bacterium]|nr:hypothetical protein [Lachnospiraceae bacterium]
MADIYNICFYGGLILASLLLVVSIVLFIVLKIPSVIGELTGRTAKKSIEEMKASNKGSSAVSKKEQGKYYNQTSGKIKIRQAASTETIKNNNDDITDILGDNAISDTEKTEHASGKAANDKGKTTDNLKDEEATDVLGDEEATDVLRDEEAT